MDPNAKDFYAKIPDRNPNLKIPFAPQKYFLVEVDYHNTGFRIIDGYKNIQSMQKAVKKGIKSQFDIMCVQQNTTLCIPKSRNFDKEAMAKKCEKIANLPREKFMKNSEEFDKYQKEKEENREGVMSKEEWEELTKTEPEPEIEPEIETDECYELPMNVSTESEYKHAVLSFVEDESNGEHAFVIYGLHKTEERARDHMQDTISKRILYSDLYIAKVGSFIYPEDSFKIKGTNTSFDIVYRHKTLNEVRKSLFQDDEVYELKEQVKIFHEAKEDRLRKKQLEELKKEEIVDEESQNLSIPD